jgi:hypothetical protein
MVHAADVMTSRPQFENEATFTQGILRTTHLLGGIYLSP